MTATEVQTFTDREAFVWLGFRRDASLDFKVTLPRDWDEARRIVAAVPCYNAFDPEEAWRIIDGWRQYVMRVEIAREGSPALYFTFPVYMHQTLDNTEAHGIWLTRDMEPVGTETCRVFAAQLAVDLTDAGACETSYDPSARVLRAWWD